MRSSHFPNPLSRVIFEGEATLKCCVASAEIIAFNSDEEYIKMQNTTEVIIDCSAKPKKFQETISRDPISARRGLRFFSLFHARFMLISSLFRYVNNRKAARKADSQRTKQRNEAQA